MVRTYCAPTAILEFFISLGFVKRAALSTVVLCAASPAIVFAQDVQVDYGFGTARLAEVRDAEIVCEDGMVPVRIEWIDDATAIIQARFPVVALQEPAIVRVRRGEDLSEEPIGNGTVGFRQVAPSLPEQDPANSFEDWDVVVDALFEGCAGLATLDIVRGHMRIESRFGAFTHVRTETRDDAAWLDRVTYDVPLTDRPEVVEMNQFGLEKWVGEVSYYDAPTLGRLGFSFYERQAVFRSEEGEEMILWMSASIVFRLIRAAAE